MSVQYTAVGLQEYSWSAIVLYYGLKFTFVLRAHITATETRDNIPPKAFGFGDLKSGSPARYLLIMVRITVTARGSILLLGGSLANIRAWEKGDFLRPENERWSHVMAVTWTCLITVAYFVQLTLVAVHCSRNRRNSVNGLRKKTSTLQVMMNVQSSMNALTLHFSTENSESGSGTSLERALSRLAKAYRPGQELTESSISSEDAQTVADVDDEDLRKRVARSAIIPHSAMIKMEDTTPADAATSDFSSKAIEQDSEMREFRLLQLQHQSSLRRIRALKSARPHSVRGEKIRVLQQQLQETHQHLEQLQDFYHQLHPLPGHQQSEGSANMDPAESVHQLHLRSNMSVLQHQVKFMLRQLDSRIMACRSDTD